MNFSIHTLHILHILHIHNRLVRGILRIQYVEYLIEIREETVMDGFTGLDNLAEQAAMGHLKTYRPVEEAGPPLFLSLRGRVPSTMQTFVAHAYTA